MNIGKSEIIVILIILLSFLISIYFYPAMPEKMSSHWNIRGEVDGYMSKFWSLFLIPIISSAIFLLFVIIPKIDPLKANIAKFRNYYNGLIVLIIVFLFYLYILTILWNLGITFSMLQFLSPAFGIVLFYCGILLKKAKRNWFIGIKTPWTISNERVWNKTHKLGGRLFKISGIIAFLGIFFQHYAIFLIIVPVILVTIYTYIYSYFEYQKEIKKRKRVRK
jgi:uncharacterized membrane protein